MGCRYGRIKCNVIRVLDCNRLAIISLSDHCSLRSPSGLSTSVTRVHDDTIRRSRIRKVKMIVNPHSPSFSSKKRKDESDERHEIRGVDDHYQVNDEGRLMDDM